MSKNRVVIQEAVLKANSGYMEHIKEEMKYYLSTEINAQNKLFTEFGGTYDFESAI